MLISKLASAIQPGLLRLLRRECPACGQSVFVRLGAGELAVRCMRCAATPVHLAVVEAINAGIRHPGLEAAYELSSRGPVLRYLRKKFNLVICSEYFEGVESGAVIDGVRCEDVQQLSFDDESFDLCTSTEVFEHVPDDMAGFRQVHRVLKPGGHFVFTVPLADAAQTRERAALVGGQLVHLLLPEYHGDRISGSNSVLVFRDYGADICERLEAAGFRRAYLYTPVHDYFGHSRKAVVAQK